MSYMFYYYLFQIENPKIEDFYYMHYIYVKDPAMDFLKIFWIFFCLLMCWVFRQSTKKNPEPGWLGVLHSEGLAVGGDSPPRMLSVFDLIVSI